MIRVVKRDGSYLKAPSLSIPWKMTVTLFSNHDTKTIYEDNKEIIKSWLGLISELMMNLDENGVFVRTTMWEDGEVEFSFNYTMTKLNDLVLSKELLFPSARWNWVSKSSMYKRPRILSNLTATGVKLFSNISNNSSIIKPKPIRPHEVKEFIIRDSTRKQKNYKKIELL